MASKSSHDFLTILHPSTTKPSEQFHNHASLERAFLASHSRNEPALAPYAHPSAFQHNPSLLNLIPLLRVWILRVRILRVSNLDSRRYIRPHARKRLEIPSLRPLDRSSTTALVRLSSTRGAYGGFLYELTR